MTFIFPIVADWWHQTSWFGDGHNGLDWGALVGSAIVAPVDLTITAAGWSDAGYGYHVRGVDSDGNIYIFGHMYNQPIVKVGEAIGAGNPLGVVGSTGNSDGPHLHFEMRTPSGAQIDPTPFIESSIEITGDIFDKIKEWALAWFNGTPTGIIVNTSELGGQFVGEVGSAAISGGSVSDVFSRWLARIPWKRIYQNWIVVTVGMILLGLGVYWLITSDQAKSLAYKAEGVASLAAPEVGAAITAASEVSSDRSSDTVAESERSSSASES